MDVLSLILAVCGALLVAVVVRNSLALAQLRKDLDDTASAPRALPSRTDSLTAPVEGAENRRATRRSFLLKYTGIVVDGTVVTLQAANSDTELPADSYIYVPGMPGKQFKVVNTFAANVGGSTTSNLALAVSDQSEASDLPFPDELAELSAFIVVSEKIENTGYSI
jgi:hypothetical protein